jgi:glycosyltransferase involved in cell wall biosynthesis
VPLFSVVVPAYNRHGELRRALQSVAAQSLTDFECVVVDDASHQPLEGIVAEFDERFKWVRREANGGCSAARHTGMRYAQGDYVTGVDTDNQLYPWALERAAHYLSAYPGVDGATGLYMFPEGLRKRIAQGVKLEGPDDYANRSSYASVGDSVGVVRRSVLEEWRSLRPDYYNLDFVFILRFRLSHRVVLVDEPWGVYHTTATDRIGGSRDPRVFDDMVKFAGEFRPLVGIRPCGPVDLALSNMWVSLVRARRYRDAAVVGSWMHERGLSRSKAVVRKLAWRVRSEASRVVPVRAYVL